MAIQTDEQDIHNRLNGSGNLLNRLKQKQPSSNKPVSSQNSGESSKPSSPNGIPEDISEPPLVEVPQNTLSTLPPSPPKPKILCSVTVNAKNLGGPGYGNNTPTAIDKETKLICAALAKIAGPKVAARATGVSLSSAYDYMKGDKQTSDGKRVPDIELRDRMKEIFPRIQDTAIDRFYLAAKFLDEEALKAIPMKFRALTMSQIMTNMMRAVSATLPKENNNIVNNNMATVTVMTAEQKSEADYETVDVTPTRRP